MSVFKLPKDTCYSIQSVINKFWWNHGTNNRKIHWLSSARLCKRKEDRGLGFWDLEAFNDALLAKQFWRLMHDNSSMCFKILKAQYFPDCNLFEARLGSKPSYIWRSLQGVFDLVCKGSRWAIGNEKSVHIWKSRWLPRPSSFNPILLGEPSSADRLVSKLINKEEGVWRKDLVRRLLPIDADIILQIPLCTSWPSDRLIWHYSTSGLFFVWSAYHLAHSLQFLSLASGNSNGMKEFWRVV